MDCILLHCLVKPLHWISGILFTLTTKKWRWQSSQGSLECEIHSKNLHFIKENLWLLGYSSETSSLTWGPQSLPFYSAGPRCPLGPNPSNKCYSGYFNTIGKVTLLCLRKTTLRIFQFNMIIWFKWLNEKISKFYFEQHETLVKYISLWAGEIAQH